MSDLTRECCSPTASRLDPAELSALLAALPEWRVNDTPALVREFRFKNFYHVMSFVNAIAWLANKEGHHPDLEVGYGRVQVCFTTHDVGGLSRNDFICAAKTDALLRLGQVGPALV